MQHVLVHSQEDQGRREHDQSDITELPADSSLQGAPSRQSSGGERTAEVERLTQQVHIKDQELAQLRSLLQSYRSESTAELDELRERMAKFESMMQDGHVHVSSPERQGQPSGLPGQRGHAGPGALLQTASKPS